MATVGVKTHSEWEGLESNIQLVVIYNFTARWEIFLHNVALRVKYRCTGSTNGIICHAFLNSGLTFNVTHGHLDGSFASFTNVVLAVVVREDSIL